MDWGQPLTVDDSFLYQGLNPQENPNSQEMEEGSQNMIRNIQVDELSWEPHPLIEGLLIKKLLSHEKDNIDLSIMMVKVRLGMEVQEHVHEQDDIIYQLAKDAHLGAVCVTRGRIKRTVSQ
jgi:hypothetical protein